MRGREDVRPGGQKSPFFVTLKDLEIWGNPNDDERIKSCMCCLCFTLSLHYVLCFLFVHNQQSIPEFSRYFQALKQCPGCRDSGWVCRYFLEFSLLSKCWLLSFSLFIVHLDAMPWSPAHCTSPAHHASPRWGFIYSQIRFHFRTKLLLLTLKASFQMLPQAFLPLFACLWISACDDISWKKYGYDGT